MATDSGWRGTMGGGWETVYGAPPDAALSNNDPAPYTDLNNFSFNDPNAAGPSYLGNPLDPWSGPISYDWGTGSYNTGGSLEDYFSGGPDYTDAMGGYSFNDPNAEYGFMGQYGDLTGGLSGGNMGDYSGSQDLSGYSFEDENRKRYVPTSTDKGAIFGKEGYGDGRNMLQQWSDAVRPYQGLVNNPIIGTLMNMNPATAAIRMALQGPSATGGGLGSIIGSRFGPVGSIVGGLVGRQGTDYAMNGQFTPMSGQQVGGTLGSLFGVASGLPYGGMVGSRVGAELGGMDPSGGASYRTGNTSTTGGMSLGDYVAMGGGIGGAVGGQPNMMTSGINQTTTGALAGALLSNYNKKNVNNQIRTLEGMYGQNSAYAQALRQQLERRDAAAGRRSQYGPREVELQAALAGNASKLAPQVGQLRNQKNQITNMLVASLLNNRNLTSDISNAISEIGDLFGGGG